ncbi:hypothetical protein HMI50_37530 [Corallococcus carmarthensis]|nr:hypothetical protein [Corallococcus carmarthensis]
MKECANKADWDVNLRLLDFKFPCPISNDASWRRYPRNHPYAGRTQGQMYEQALGVRPWLIVPILGAAP